ncbi:capsular biosynthesis protein [Sphingomonas gei]|uniref:Capsular biosynthesis protein n=1 Tax=Sphingomonas gei TaxID=1395960 RepID=A0A4S1WYN7_9SPHN|nr:capsular biosynthesis protein [Sphingomonas gei]TGX48689.1 capsular biosynthesis protein [Sphingomonas gei]
MTRTFLFLQGPPGPFFRQLGEALRCAGGRVLRVNFHGGDCLDWGARAIDFRGVAEAWPAALGAIIERHRVTDIVLFGDCRPLHHAAISTAHAWRVTVHVFEEGYVRPDWVTLEQNGVNGHSSLPPDPEYYCRIAAGLAPVPNLPQVPASFVRRAREAMAYYGAGALLTPWFRHYRSHRPFSRTAEAAGWLRRLGRHPFAARRSRAVRCAMASPYFVVPLQLDADYQLRIHSPFGGMENAIRAILASFAAHAHAGPLLLFKGHPLDNGLRNWRRLIEIEASALGISDRVRYLECADIATLVAHAHGVVTVNSTTGTLALAAGVPVKVLGRAVYDVPGITHQGALENFWQTPGRPQVELFDAFRRVLAHRCLLRGGFSSREGRTLLIEPAVTRMLAAGSAAEAGPPLKASA